MSKRKLSETEKCPPKKLVKLNSGSFGDVFSNGLTAYKISRYNVQTSHGIDNAILNEIIYLKKFIGQEFILSLNSVESVINNSTNNSTITMKILVPLAICDLSSYIQDHSLIERGKIWDLLTSNLINAMNYLHQNQVCHLDIKPENILYFANHFKLNDFNLSITTQNLRKGIEHPSMTCLYRSPEVIIHNNYHQVFEDFEITIKSDMWSLGCTLYEFITGDPLFNIKHNAQLLKLLHFRLTETRVERTAYNKYNFLKELDQKVYSSIALISLKSYLNAAFIQKPDQWYDLIFSMLNVQQDLRPEPKYILKKMNWSYKLSEKPLNNWINFNYLNNFKEKVGDQTKFCLFDKVKFMTKLKYDYKNNYDRWHLWKLLWLSYQKKYQKLNDQFETLSNNGIFLEIFEIYNRYLEQLPIINFRSSNDFLSLFIVIMRLVYKIRRPEKINDIFCIPLEQSNHIELDIIKMINYDFSLSPVQDVDFDFDKFFEI